ncbi:MAG: isocitrate lyase/phosphoenolpyruvate mutase family protein [Alphaproteobacteria bacterium]
MEKPEQIARAKSFGDLHHAERILVMANPWDVVSARLFYKAGFPALATTSGGVAFAQGYPDGEKISREEMAAAVKRIADAIPIPLSADMEGGYGPAPEDVAETVRQAIAAGAVGVNIEDSTKEGPNPLFDPSLAVERIRAAVEAGESAGVPIVVNARTDGFRQGDDSEVFDDTVRRANAYRAAGAACLFVPWVRDADRIGELVRQIEGPVNVLAAASSPPVAALEALGVARVTVGASLSRACLTTARAAAAEMLGPGTFEFGRDVMTQAQVHDLIKD